MIYRKQKFEAWISDGAERLTEYKAKLLPGQSAMECYVESKLGMSFSIGWEDLSRQRETVGIITIDGMAVADALTKGDASQGEEYWREVDDIQCTAKHARPLVFVKSIPPTVGQSFHRDADDFGTIQIDIQEVDITNTLPNGNFTPHEVQKCRLLDLRVDEECSAITGGICVGLGYPIECCSANGFDYEPKTNKPPVTFYFYYRSREFLIENGYLLAESICGDNSGQAESTTPTASRRKTKKRARQSTGGDANLRRSKRKQKQSFDTIIHPQIETQDDEAIDISALDLHAMQRASKRARRDSASSSLSSASMATARSSVVASGDAAPPSASASLPPRSFAESGATNPACLSANTSLAGSSSFSSDTLPPPPIHTPSTPLQRAESHQRQNRRHHGKDESTDARENLLNMTQQIETLMVRMRSEKLRLNASMDKACNRTIRGAFENIEHSCDQIKEALDTAHVKCEGVKSEVIDLS